MLAHPRYGPTVAAVLDEASQVAEAVLGRPVDLRTRVENKRETQDLTTYAEDLALIIAVEMAQLRLLDQFFGIAMRDAKLAFGYSLGEASALIGGGVYEMQHLLRAPLTTQLSSWRADAGLVCVIAVAGVGLYGAYLASQPPRAPARS